MSVTSGVSDVPTLQLTWVKLRFELTSAKPVTLSLHNVIKVDFEYENELIKEKGEEWPCMKY